MNKKRILQFIIAASTLTGGISFSNTTAEATELAKDKTVDNNTNSRTIKSLQKGKVINVSSSLRIRSSASTNSSIIGYLYNGNEFDILEKSGEWYKINYSNGSGYIHSDYVKIIKSESTDSGTSNTNSGTSSSKKGEVINVSSTLRIRSAASTNSTILGTINNGQTFDILGKSGVWYNIKSGSIKGYIHGDYVKELGTGTGSTSKPPSNNNSSNSTNKIGQVINISTNLRVRTEPNSSSTVLGYLTNGAKVNIKGESGSWYKIEFDEKKGYVHKDYIKVIGNNNDTSNNNNESVKPPTNNNSNSVVNKTGQVYNISTNLRVRSEANSNSSVLGYLTNGFKVKILGETSGWYKINFNGKTGYVHSDYIKIVEGSANESESSSYETIYKAMKANIGAPYIWGGAGEKLTTSLLNDLKKRFPSDAANGMYARAEQFVDQGYRAFDCSGLMQWGFKQAGIHIGRTTWDQINAGVEVSLNKLKPGDLLFYSDLQHVGMYLGDDQWIESPNKNANVRVTSVPWNKIGRARRVLN